MQTSIKILCNHLFHSVLRVKAKGGGIFAPCLHPPRRRGEGHFAPPFLSCRRLPTAHAEVKIAAFTPKLLNNRKIVGFQ